MKHLSLHLSAFFYRPISLTSIFLSRPAKYGLFTQPLSLSPLFLFLQLSIKSFTMPLSCFFHCGAKPLSQCSCTFAWQTGCGCVGVGRILNKPQSREYIIQCLLLFFVNAFLLLLQPGEEYRWWDFDVSDWISSLLFLNVSLETFKLSQFCFGCLNFIFFLHNCTLHLSVPYYTCSFSG